MKKLMIGVALLASLLVAVAVGTASGGPPTMVTICHASGQAGTLKFETLTIPENAVYPNAQGHGGHFGEGGTVLAGHEQDYFGACHETPPIDVCPDMDGVQTDPEDCAPPVDQCPNIAGVQTDPEDCEQPPVDYCETLPGVQAEDEDCPPPPVDVCPNIEGNQPEGTNCNPVIPPPPPRLCPDGKPPTPGEGAYDPNDDCKRPPEPPVTPPRFDNGTPPTVTPPVTPPTTVTPPVTTPKPVVKPKPKPKPKAKPKPKPDKPPVVKKKVKKVTATKHVCLPLKYTDSNGKVWTTARVWTPGMGCVAAVRGSG